MITPEEKEQLKAEIMADIEDKLKGTLIREDTQSVLSEVRHKWFGNSGHNGLMNRVFEIHTVWKIWELVRKLTCLICGTGYVRRLSGKEEIANKLADKLCLTIYTLRLQYINWEADHGKEA